MAAGTIRTKHRTRYKPSVVEKYESMLRVHALDPDRGLGSFPIDEIEPRDVRCFIDDLADRTSPGTAHKVLTALKVVGRQAVAEGGLSVSPFANVTAPRSDEEKPARVLTVSEADRIRKAALSLDEAARRSRTYPMIALAFATGLRMGELLALRYGADSLDLEIGLIVVGPRGNLSRTRGPNGSFTLISPKSRASRRQVEMSPSAVQALRRHRGLARFSADGDFVFVDERGEPLCGATVAYRDWRRAVTRASIPDPRPRFHDARHHWALVMLRAGIQPQAVMKLGGWSSLKVLLDRYGRHALPSELQGSGVRLDDYLASQRVR